MNWKLVSLLSLSGILVGLLSVYLVSARYEAILATPFFLGCGWYIGRYSAGRFFLQGFVTGLLSIMWSVGVRILMVSAYLQHHSADAAQYIKMAAEAHGTVTQVMLLTGSVMSLMGGVMVGSFALVANKFVRVLGGER